MLVVTTIQNKCTSFTTRSLFYQFLKMQLLSITAESLCDFCFNQREIHSKSSPFTEAVINLSLRQVPRFLHSSRTIPVHKLPVVCAAALLHCCLSPPKSPTLFPSCQTLFPKMFPNSTCFLRKSIYSYSYQKGLRKKILIK